MVSALFFSQLMLVALVWLGVMLHWAWPSDTATYPTALEPYPHCPSTHVSPNPLWASPTNRLATPVSTTVLFAHSPFIPATTHRHDTRAPPSGRHLHAFLPTPGLCLSGLGGSGQSPRQWPSQWW